MGSVSEYQDKVEKVSGDENLGSIEDRYVKCLLDQISSKALLVEDRKTAISELQSIVCRSSAGRMVFGEMGFRVILSILKEEPYDFGMVMEALETLLTALVSMNHAKWPANVAPPDLINSNLLFCEEENVSILLSLLSQEDSHVRYYTFQLLTTLLTNSSQKLLEAICSIPGGIKQLMSSLNDSKAIRSRAMSLLTYLNCDAEEIQKILVSEGGFVKIFSIIEDEGGSEGGVEVQDCLTLLNKLLHNSASNQTTNVLSVLEIINLLIMGAPEMDPSRDSNKLTNKTVLVQKKALDHLFMLGVASQCAPVPVRCMALHCIGDLIVDHPKNLKELASKRFGEEPDLEPALKSVFQMLLLTSSKQEFMAADYLLKNFCQQNPNGQTILLSLLIRQLQSINMSFQRLVLELPVFFRMSLRVIINARKRFCILNLKNLCPFYEARSLCYTVW